MSRRHALGRHAEIIFIPEDRAAGVPALEMERALADGRASDERWHERGDGTRFFGIGELLPIRNETGGAEGFVKILRDGTAMRKAQSALRESEEKFQAIANSVDQMIWSTLPDGYHDYYNQRWYEFTGVPAGSTDGEAWNGMFHPDDQDRAWAVWRHSLATGEPYHIEYRLRHRSGKYRWVLGRAQPVRDDTGAIIRWYGTCTDIHDLKIIQDALRETEERYRLALLATSDAIWDWDLTTDHVLWNEALQAAYGHAPESVESTGAWWVAQIHPEDRTRVEAGIHAVLDGGDTTWTNDYRFRRADGTYADVFDRGAVIRDEDGRAVRMIGAMLDLSERKQAEEALRQSEARFREMADHISQFAWTANAEGWIYWYNKRWYDYTGATPEEVAGWGWTRVHHPDHVDRVRAKITECFRLGKEWEDTFPLRGRDGEYRWFLSRAMPIRNQRGEVIRWFGTNTDVTELRDAEAALRQSEDRLRMATEAAAIGTWDYDPVGGTLRWDARSKALSGLPPDASVSYEGTFLAALHPEDRERIHSAIYKALTPGAGTYDVEYRTVGLEDGVERWVAAKGQGVFEGDRPVRFVGTIIDITDRKRSEAALSRSEAALREESTALEILNRTMTKIAAELDLGRLAQIVVDAGVELTGAEIGAFRYHAGGSADQSEVLCAVAGTRQDAFDRFPMRPGAGVLGGGGLVRSEDVTKDSGYGQSPRDEGHPMRSYLAVPVTARSGEVIGGLFLGHTDAGRFEPRAERLVTGLAAQAATGIDNARLFQASQRLNQTLEAQVEARTQERDRIWQVSQDLLGVADLNGAWRSVNPAWTRVLGWQPTDILGRSSEWLHHPDDRAKVAVESRRLVAGERTALFETRMRTRTGDYRTLSWTAVNADGALYCTARDVTEEKARQLELEQTQDRLRQAQKMETVGQLTGGVAHDFNNLLQIVTGNLEILERNLPESDQRLRRVADNAMNGAKRAATLTHRLLAFSRRQPLAPKPTDANKLIAGMSDLLHRTIGETVEIETVLSPGIWRIEVDPNQLENAILNLAVNARDAMPGGGKLTVETSNSHLDCSYGTQHGDVTPGDYVVVAVSDTGIGMDEETAQRVFEPFFTTKEVGKGTGLGLSMVYGFVKQSGGHVKIDSKPGEGTALNIYLPRLNADAVDEEEVAAPPVPEGTRSETILVCEDDEDVRGYSVEVLRELGYRVLSAPDGPSALTLLQQQASRIDLLFTDVVLPGGMTGADLARRARELVPELKVLFTTGYARDAIVHQGRLDAGVELITKPFAYAELAGRIRDLLDIGDEDAAG